MTPQKRSTPTQVRKLALALPETFESSHFAQPDFRVHNKIFATLPSDGRVVVLRLAPNDVYALASGDGATFWDEWRGRWLGVRLDRISLPLLGDLIGQAWKTVAPKHLAAKTKRAGT